MGTVNHIFKSGKLLICFLDRRRGDHLMEVSKKAGARGGTIASGRTTGNSRVLQMLSLADIDQDVVFTLMGEEREQVLSALLAAAEKEPKKLGGVGILLDVAGMLIRHLSPPEQKEVKMAEETRENSGYELITIIVNNGYADDVMAAARKAGARGGTILTARGTGTEEDVKFFGISLVPEKEMLLIVAEKETVADILAAVGELPDMRQPGGGVAFHLNIERFMLLGQATEK